jgi:hypothetical protein
MTLGTKQPYGRRKSLFRAQYNALGKRNLAGEVLDLSELEQKGETASLSV